MTTHATGVGDNTRTLFIAILQTARGINRNSVTGQARKITGNGAKLLC